MLSLRFVRAALPLLIAALVCALLVTVPSSAQAADLDREESPKTFVTSLSFGGFWFQDDYIQASYNSKGKFVPKVTFGVVPLSRYVHIEVNLSFAFLQFPGKATFVDTGESSADSVMLTLFPLNLDLSVGIDIVDEQPVVPYGGVGVAWTLWREHVTGGGEEWSGYRLGYNAFFGAALLLDRIEQRRAREVDAAVGVNDAFLTLEGRFAKVDSELEDGDLVKGTLDFSGWSFLAGLKLVY